MRKTLKDFYHGNINPSAQVMTARSGLSRATDQVVRCEQQLTDRLDEVGQALLTELTDSQHEVNSITAQENFILGFRLGARIIAECMDENDGDIQALTDEG